MRPPQGVHNALASLKTVFDGITDRGVLADDSPLTHAPIHFAIDRTDPRVEITIQREESP